ncbi:golgin subfamily A member 6-like protein 22 isoform X1 [Tachysurus fulvidraco]|uniref:golgin subfamily A member 6-like protein 22 isoform X1 n=1 Tax=Tachysurus fulvidraco TaxID=1234273 RepID=UPI001FED976C|nr:golgin subfamily A member 6-like protein 22 isoform X1 [Tachysurus fulvidraco]
MVVYNLFNSVVLDLLLRHLLLVAGAAVVTVCIYYYVQRDDGEQTTADTEDTTVPEDPVYEQTTEPALVRPTEVVQDQMMEAESEAEEKIQELVVPKIQLEDRVKELEELLCEARRSYDLKSKECELEQEAHSILQTENDKMKKTIAQLEEQNDQMSSQELLMNVILAEAEEKHQKDVKTITQLVEEKSDLEERVEALRDTLRKTKNLLNESKRKFDDMFNEQDQETHCSLCLENQEMQDTIVQMEMERSEKLIQMENQKNKMKDLGNLVFDMNMEIAHLTNEQKRAREDCSILRAENMKMKKEEELLKVTLSEAEEQHQKDLETITQLEEENSELTEKVQALRDTVEEMGKELLETNRECEELMTDREAHSILQSEVNEMKKIISQLEEQNSEMKITLIHKEELLKVTRAKAEEQHQKDVETIVQLEEENYDLTEKVEALRGTVEELGKELLEFNRECDELMNEQEAHSILQSENSEMKKTLIHKVTLAEAEGQHQNNVETTTQLEKESSDLTERAEALRDTVEELGKDLIETHLQCDELTGSVSERLTASSRPSTMRRRRS